MSSVGARDAFPRWTLPAMFAFGLLASALMIVRYQPGSDAMMLLARGWLLVTKGTWVHVGNPTTLGGFVPGGLTALLTGLPLAAWMDPRAPVILILILHVWGYVLLDRIVKETLGNPARVLFAIFYWISPWRVFQGGWLNNPSYNFLVGAVHLWATYRQRSGGRFVHSLLLVAVVGLSAQVHLSAVLLVLASFALWLRGYWKPHWGGVVLGAAITFGMLVPYFLEARAYPEIVPGDESSGLPGILTVWPLLKGVAYWLRYSSLSVSARSMLVFDFTASLGPAPSELLARCLYWLGQVVGTLSVAVPIVANLRAWRRYRGRLRRRPRGQADVRSWLAGYAGWTLAGGLGAAAISTGPMMWWYEFHLFHAAVLPAVLWLTLALRTRHASRVRGGLIAYVAVSVVLVLGMIFGGEFFSGVIPDGNPDRARANLEVSRDLGVPQWDIESWNAKERYFYRVHLSRYELPDDAPGDGR